MSRYLVPLIDGLRLAAREVWTDLSGDYQAVEVFHLDLTRKAQETPWLVIDLRLLPSGQRKAETAVDRSSEGMAVLYRVVTDGESLDELIGKLEDLRDQLEDAEPAPGWVLEHPLPAWDPDLPLNRFFADAQAPLIAGAVTVHVYGEE